MSAPVLKLDVPQLAAGPRILVTIELIDGPPVELVTNEPLRIAQEAIFVVTAKGSEGYPLWRVKRWVETVSPVSLGRGQ